MSAQVFSLGEMVALLPKTWPRTETLTGLRDSFECAFAILCYAVEKDLQTFSFASLRLPACFSGTAPAESFSEATAIEVAVFQEHLYDRIALLAQNRQMLREIWKFNAHSRKFRQAEFRSLGTRLAAIEGITNLIAALEAKDEARTMAALKEGHIRELRLIEMLCQDLADLSTGIRPPE